MVGTFGLSHYSWLGIPKLLGPPWPVAQRFKRHLAAAVSWRLFALYLRLILSGITSELYGVLQKCSGANIILLIRDHFSQFAQSSVLSATYREIHFSRIMEDRVKRSRLFLRRVQLRLLRARLSWLYCRLPAMGLLLLILLTDRPAERLVNRQEEERLGVSRSHLRLATFLTLLGPRLHSELTGSEGGPRPLPAALASARRFTPDQLHKNSRKF
jgi:hypothetical protein